MIASPLTTHIFTDWVETIRIAMMSRSYLLIEEGKNLTYLLTMMIWCYRLFYMLLEDSSSHIQQLIKHTFYTIFVLFLLMQWHPLITGIFHDGINDIATRIEASTENRHISQKIYQAIEKSQRMDKPNSVLGNLFFWKNITYWISKLLVWFFLQIILLLYVTISNLGGLLICMGSVIGPILVPWLILPASQFLFYGWLSFMISAGLYQVIGATCIVIIDIAVNSIHTLQDSHDALAATSQLSLLTLTLMLSFITSIIMLRIPSIANGITQGGTFISFNTHMMNRMGLNVYKNIAKKMSNLPSLKAVVQSVMMPRSSPNFVRPIAIEKRRKQAANNLRRYPNL